MDCFSCVSCLIGNSKVAASEVVEDIEDMRESRRMLACAAKTAAGAPSYAAVTRTLLLLPQTRPTKQARRPSDASNVSHTVSMTAPIKVVDTPPKTQMLPLTLTKKSQPPSTLKLPRILSMPSPLGSKYHSSLCSWETGQHTFKICPKIPQKTTSTSYPTSIPLSPIHQLERFYHTLVLQVEKVHDSILALWRDDGRRNNTDGDKILFTIPFCHVCPCKGCGYLKSCEKLPTLYMYIIGTFCLSS